jgi:hypothetical protein
MRKWLPGVLLAALTIGAALLSAFAGAALAVGQLDDSPLDVDLSSTLSADYSADPLGVRLAPLSPEIIAAAAEDARRLSPVRPDAVPATPPAAAGPIAGAVVGALTYQFIRSASPPRDRDGGEMDADADDVDAM